MADETTTGGGGAPEATGGANPAATGGEGGGAPASTGDWMPEGYSTREEFEADWKKFGGKEKISRYQEVHDHFNQLADMPDVGEVVNSLYLNKRLPDGYGRQQQQQQREPQQKRERYKYFDESKHPDARQRYYDEVFGADPGQLLIQGAENDEDFQDAIWKIVANRLGNNPAMGNIHKAAFQSTYQRQIQSLHPNVAKWFNAGPMNEQRLREAMELSQGLGGGQQQQPGPNPAAVQQQAQQSARLAGGNRGAGGAPSNGKQPEPKKGDKASKYLTRA